MHCALSLGEETEGADKEALPVEPDRRRKPSAEERLDTVLDFENTTGEGCGTNTPSPQPFVGGIVYCWRGTTEGAWPACAEDGNSKSGLERPFSDQFNKHVLQTEALHLGKGLMSGKGTFLFPRKKVPVFPGASKALSSTCVLVLW